MSCLPISVHATYSCSRPSITEFLLPLSLSIIAVSEKSPGSRRRRRLFSLLRGESFAAEACVRWLQPIRRFCGADDLRAKLMAFLSLPRPCVRALVLHVLAHLTLQGREDDSATTILEWRRASIACPFPSGRRLGEQNLARLVERATCASGNWGASTPPLPARKRTDRPARNRRRGCERESLRMLEKGNRGFSKGVPPRRASSSWAARP